VLQLHIAVIGQKSLAQDTPQAQGLRCVFFSVFVYYQVSNTVEVKAHHTKEAALASSVKFEDSLRLYLRIEQLLRRDLAFVTSIMKRYNHLT
jgi:hypothetical protein